MKLFLSIFGVQSVLTFPTHILLDPILNIIHDLLVIVVALLESNPTYENTSVNNTS